MISGKRVLDYLNMVNEQNHQVSVKLSAKATETARAVERLQEENYRLKAGFSVWNNSCATQRQRDGRALEMYFYFIRGWMQTVCVKWQML